MAIKNLVPSLWRRESMPAKWEESHPFHGLQQEMNRLFDDFFRGFEPTPFQGLEERLMVFSPSVDVKETDKEIVVKAELPGIDEQDIEVLLSENALTIKGEKKEEKEEKTKQYHRVERAYGAFNRMIPLPGGMDMEKAKSIYKNGILTIKLPKTETFKSKTKKIPIKRES